MHPRTPNQAEQLARPTATGRQSRGQLFSIDILVAVTIALFLFITATTLSTRVMNVLGISEQEIELNAAAEAAAAQLAASPGNPLNWDALSFSDASVNSIGLAESRNVLAPAKVGAFFALASNQTALPLVKKMLGVSRPGYGFSVRIYNQTGSLVNGFSTGAGTGKPATVAERIGVLNGSLVRLSVGVWIE
ncbi:MAG: hypothetical protein NTY90_01650 [Candidatus Micrarchaeota archaeon]|nr:hypothetical protein [Candidatus Micrarchaeota archaeon]